MSVPHTTFALITDTHYSVSLRGEEPTLWNRQLVARSKELAELLIHSINHQPLDFIIHCGDITHNGDRRSFEFARSIFDQFRVPVFFTLGNRDPLETHARSMIKEVFSLNRDQFFFVHYVNGVRYIFLDSNYAHFADGREDEVIDRAATGSSQHVGYSAAQLRWLETELDRDRESITLVIAHHPIASKSEYPIIKPRDLGPPNVRLGPVWQALFPVYYREVLALLEGASNVKAVFSGHWHISDIVRVNSLYHVKTPSLVEFPFEYRVVRVSEQYLDVSTHGLGSDLVEQASLVPQWYNEWVKGESFDRDRRIYFDDNRVQTRA